MAQLQLQRLELAIERQEVLHPDVVVEGPVSPNSLAGLAMNEGLANFRPPKRQKTALID